MKINRRIKNLVFYAPIYSHSVALASAAGVLHDVRRRVSPSTQSLSEEVIVREGGRRGRQGCRYDARAQPRAARGMPRPEGDDDQRQTVPTSRRGRQKSFR
jgi:hypothetical protein